MAKGVSEDDNHTIALSAASCEWRKEGKRWEVRQRIVVMSPCVHRLVAGVAHGSVFDPRVRVVVQPDPCQAFGGERRE